MSKFADFEEKTMSAIKRLAPAVALTALAAGPASAHPVGHGGFSIPALIAHLATNAFHIGIVVAAVAVVMMLARRPRSSRDPSEAADE